jgi:hypothetical protein
MKLITAILAVTLATPALARVGESIEQIKARYGSLTGVAPIESVPYFTLGFESAGLVITVAFDDKNVSQLEMFKRKDGSELSDEEIQVLLEANSGGFTWKAPSGDQRTKIWESIDGKSRYAISTGGRTLIVTSKDFWESSASAMKKQKADKLNGF